MKQVRSTLLIILVAAFLTGNGGLCSGCFLSSLYHHLVEGHHSHKDDAAHACGCHKHEGAPHEHFDCTHDDAKVIDVALPDYPGKTTRQSVTWLETDTAVAIDCEGGLCRSPGKRVLILPLCSDGRPPGAPLFILNEQLLI